MPQVPTNEKGPTILGAGSPLGETGPNPFGYQIGQSMEKVGDDIARTGVIGGTIVAHRREMDADTWANDSMAQLRDFYTDWMSDEENNTKESFASEFKRLSQKTLEEYESKAPNEIARLKFREQFQRFENSHYAAAVTTSAQTKVSNLIDSHNDQNNSVIEAYEKHRLIPNLDANAEILGDLTERFAAIDETFKKTAPNKGLQLKAQLAEDAAFATLRYSPLTARKVLAMSTGILEQRRIHAIESQIETAENANHALDIQAVHTRLKNRVKHAENGGQPGYFVLEDIPEFISRDKAQALINDANAEIDVHNTANLHFTEIQPKSGPAQARYLHNLQNEKKDERTAGFDDAVLKLVAQRVARNMEHFEKDPAGYMLQNNEALRGIDDHIQELAKDPKKNAQQIQQRYAERDTLLVGLESPAPEGTPEHIADQHNVVNRSQIKVMSDAEAKANVRKINESSPKEALQTIQGVLFQHSKYPAIAFNNLVQLQHGDGLRGDYWLVYKNADNPDVQDLIGAIQHAESAKELNRDILTEVSQSLEANPTWMLLKGTFPNDNYQMEGMLAGIKRGVVSYATVRAQGGLNPNDAVNESVEKWINKTMAVVDVNGQGVVVDRDGRSDPQLADMGKRLGILQRVVSPADIKTTDEYGEQLFPAIFGPEGPGTEAEKIEQFRRVIADRGYFKPSSDTNAATLYIRSDSGTPFEARTTNNMAISVLLSEVEDVSEKLTFYSGESGEPYTMLVPPRIRPITGTKVEHPPLLTPEQMNDPRYRSYRNYTRRDPVETSYTNWPVEPKFIRRTPAK